jgi:MFS family permease
MPAPREFIFGPWRAVSVLGVTQIITWGAMFYPTVLTVPLIAADHGWSIAFAMGGFSLALFVGGMVSRYVGAFIDRYGGHAVMPFGSLIGAAGLLALVHATHWAAYLAVWMVIGVAMAANLYDPAFATLGRVFGAAARRPITSLTLIGGFASTVSWPVTHLLIEAVGWRGAYLTYAALLAVVAAPLHAFALPRTRAAPVPSSDDASAKPPAVLPPSGFAFVLVAAAFGAYAFVPSALSAHLLAIFGRAGIDAATVVAIGSLFGPAQVIARICEFTFARNLHPIWVARFAVALLVCAFVMLSIGGILAATAAAFALMFGAANGLLTIARGTLPLALFGAAGYGRLIGRIATPFLVMQSMAPLVLAFVVEKVSDAAALGCVAFFAVVALTCFALIRRPPDASV